MDTPIYGGLELAMALIFLLPLIRPSQLQSSLLSCLNVHACIVLFRSVSFFLFYIQPMTQKLAFYEWLIFVAEAVLVSRESKHQKRTDATIESMKS